MTANKPASEQKPKGRSGTRHHQAGRDSGGDGAGTVLCLRAARLVEAHAGPETACSATA